MSNIQLPTFAIKGLNHVKKYAPEILTGVGVIGTVGTVVLASRATLKASDVLQEFRGNKEDLEELKGIANGSGRLGEREYGVDDYKRDLVAVYTHFGVSVAKLYAPAALLGVFSVGCLIGSNHILRGRNVALAAAYKALDSDFSKYRNRVIQLFGDDADEKVREVNHEVVGKVLDPDGNEIDIFQSDASNLSPYAKFFDESSPNWDGYPNRNLMFLRQTEQYFNDRLRIHGHVFLNEVYDALGLPRTPAGQVVGWLKDTESGDGYIDFGLYERGTGEIVAKRRDFVNGYEKSVLLDFNVDGIIYELI